MFISKYLFILTAQFNLCIVYRNPAIGIISTGNELQDYTEKLKPYHIRDTNKITLKTILKQFNFNSNDCGIVKDK